VSIQASFSSIALQVSQSDCMLDAPRKRSAHSLHQGATFCTERARNHAGLCILANCELASAVYVHKTDDGTHQQAAVNRCNVGFYHFTTLANEPRVSGKQPRMAKAAPQLPHTLLVLPVAEGSCYSLSRLYC
jgi:hypothetical protein